MFRIALIDNENNRIEYLRGVSGYFNHEVFFWDTIQKEEFYDKEQALVYAKEKINALDLDLIKIVEVSL